MLSTLTARDWLALAWAMACITVAATLRLLLVGKRRRIAIAICLLLATPAWVYVIAKFM